MIRTLITAIRPGRRALHAPAHNRFVTGVAALALLMTTNPVAARSILPIQGGPGDAGFEDRCPANQFLIGIAGRSGDFVDQIQIVCSPIQPDGTHGTSYYGPTRGGAGGAASELSCNANGFVFGINFDYYNEHSKIIDVELTCRSIQGSVLAAVQFGTPGGSFEVTTESAHQHCGSDELASGLAGRYGKNVNALGLFCDARVTGSAPAPASERSAWPIRTTGKVTATPAPATDRSSWPIRTTGKVATTPADATLACPQGFVWREASPADHVCVTPVQRMLTRQENAAGPAHVSQTDQTYGSNTCVQGYVWREAFSGDVVCVTPRQRDAAAEQNSAAPALIPATSP